MLLLLGANLFWSTSGVLIKAVHVGGPALAGWRALFATLVLVVARLLLRPAPGSLRAALARPGLWVGVLAFALNTVCIVSANKLTTAANAILLQYTAPLYVLLFGALWLKEPLRKADVLAVALSFLGLALLLSERLGGGAGLGNALALAAGFFFAVIILALRDEAQGDPLLVPLLGSALALVGLSPWWLRELPPAGEWPLVAALGLGQLGLGYICYALALREVRAATAVLAAAIEPVLNPLWVLAVTGERPGFRALMGGLIVLGAVTLRAWWAARPVEQIT